MTRRSDLLALAARVEAAQGEDHKLDVDIECALEWPYAPWTGEARALTASLDAAASLVRSTQGFIAALGDIAADGMPGCCICISTDPVREVWGVSDAGDGPDGRLARAMTAAALLAMAEEAGE